MPADITPTIPRIGETSQQPDPTLHVKWFTADANWTWYVAEYDPDSRIAYGFVVGHEPEWGTFSLDEIVQIRGALGLPVERDLYFEPCVASKVTKQLTT